MGEEDPLEIKILVASDIHLGYAERDTIRKRDSIDSFEEVLKIADEKKVDMLLLGGDLFHENKPSRTIFFACTELLRKYCMNDRPVTMEFLSDASVNFNHSAFAHVNYEDPNLNVGLPVFSINGNHDDLSGQGLSALDQLHAAGLVNYFGKYQNLDKLDVSPILLRKADGLGGETKVALYGIGSIRDERLNRLFQANKVTFFTFDDTNERDKWNNILVLHQNRARHGPNNFIPENAFPEFMDMVIWGHEHPCRIKPEETSFGYKIMQPGSTVATSLAEGEAGEKCVSLLRIKGKTISDEPIPLKTIRPFYFEQITLADLEIKPGHVNTAKEVEKYCDSRVQYYLRKAKEDHPDNPRNSRPLIRLRVDYSGGYDTFNVVRFGHKYADRVANPRDIVLFHKKRELREQTNVDVGALNKAMKQSARELRNRVEDLVKSWFSEADKSQKLLLLTDNALGWAVQEFVQKDEKDAIDEMVKKQLTRMQKKVEEQAADKDNPESIKIFLEMIRDLRLQNREEDREEQADIEQASRERQQRERNGDHADNGHDEDNGNANGDDADRMDVELTAEVTPVRGRGSRGRPLGRGRGGSGRERGAPASADSTPTTTTPSGRGRPRGSTSRGRGRGRGAAKRSIDDDGEEDAHTQSSTARRSGRNSAKRSAPAYDDVAVIDDDDSF